MPETMWRSMFCSAKVTDMCGVPLWCAGLIVRALPFFTVFLESLEREAH
jgi:hypothetical protein